MNDWDLIDEELLRSAGELRPAPRRLRRRVLRAAKKAQRRRQARRRILLAASFLLPLTALGIWYQSAIDDSRSRNAAAATETPDGLLPSVIDDWDRVDASIGERQRRSRAIRSSLY